MEYLQNTQESLRSSDSSILVLGDYLIELEELDTETLHGAHAFNLAPIHFL